LPSIDFGEQERFRQGTQAAVDEAALWQALRDRLPAYMIPAQIAVLAELPKNANGKLDRKQLQQRLSGN
jgi:acyl-coenzyme A synthetase/AMP-(fatty) acid ligase